MINWILTLHYFSRRQALYAISLSTLLAGLLMAGRIHMSGSLTHIYLVWNLFLAWIPYLAGLWVAYTQQQYPRQWWLWPLPGLVWLAFFPNAPYLVTDFMHLRWYPPVPLWYDVGLLTVFAWTGLFLAVFSLRAMQLLVKQLAGTVISWLFVFGTLGLSGLGVWLGRFLRWNSWDLFFHPRAVVADVVTPLLNPLSNLQTYGVTLLFAAFLLVCYLTLASSQPRLVESANSE